MTKEKPISINTKKRRILMLLAALAAAIAVVSSVLFVSNIGKNDLRANRGALEISGWTSDKQPFALRGEWAFYWQKLLTEEQASAIVPDAFTQDIPSVWNSYRVGGKKLPARGYGTYMLTVKDAPIGEKLALYIPGALTSYKLFVDGKMLVSNGIVGTDAATSSPENRPRKVEFVPDGDSFCIVIHIANFSSAQGGMLYPITLGTPTQIWDIEKDIAVNNALLIGALLVLAFFYLGNFLLRKNDINNLYIMLMCVLFVARIGVSGGMLVYRLLPAANFDVLSDVYYLSLCGISVGGALVIGKMYPPPHYKAIQAGLLGYLAVMSLLIIIWGSLFSFWLIYAIYAVGVLVLGYSSYILLKACMKEEKDAIVTFAGMLMVFFCGVIDIVLLRNTSEFGYFALLCLSPFVVARRFTESQKSVNVLSQSLKVSDDKATAAEAAFMQAQIKPHFLFNTLNAIASFCDTDPPRAQKLIGDFSDYLRNSIDMKNPETFVPIERELGFVRSYTDIEEARFGDKLKIELDIDISAQVRVPMLSIQPLVENAINHGIRKKSGNGTVKVSVKRISKGVLVTVEDNGQGMPPEKVASLLTQEANSGIGLWNIDMRLKKLFGKGLTIESEVGKGTCVSFTVPLQEGLYD